MTVSTMLTNPPDCATYSLTPCTERDWAQCDRCYQLVCLLHDDLYDVRYSGTDPNRGTDRQCSRCVESAYGIGEISRGQEYEYINLR